MAKDYRPVTWQEYHDTALKLAATIRAHSPTVNEIVAISRGGLTLGHMLSDFLRIPIWTITIQSYTDIQKQGEIKITGKLQTSIRGKHVLLVDDVSDTGKTLKRAVTYLKRGKPASITVATMFYKPESTVVPDYFAHKTTDWIIFPYEPTEMGILLTKHMEREGRTKKQIQKRLSSLGFSDEHIAFMRKHYI